MLSGDRRAESGPGRADCDLLIPAALVVLLAVALCSVGVVPVITIFLRWVDVLDRFALFTATFFGGSCNIQM